MRAKHSIVMTALLLASRFAGAAIAAETEPARPFGFTIGDLVEQRLHVVRAPGQTLIEASLPKEGRAGAWLARRKVATTRVADGWRIDLVYQFINAPPELRTVALPAIRLELRDGERNFEETLSESPLTLAPLTPALVLARAGLEEMRPDTPPPLIDPTARLWRLSIYAALAGLIGVLWAGWHFGFRLRGRRARPFAQAEREIRRLLAVDSAPGGVREAMRRLHRAFDSAAGTTVFGPSLDPFFAGKPALAPAREGAEQFFAASRNGFFSQGGSAGDFDAARLLGLAAMLKSLEREAG